MSFAISITKSGTAASPKPTPYNHAGRVAKPKAILTGVNNTIDINASENNVAQLSCLLENGPVTNNDFSERIL